MLHKVETQWMGKMQFNALIDGHTIVMDAPVKSGGEENGSIPKPLLLTALSGCTGMDIIALLRKEKKEIKGFDMVVTGNTSKTIPVVYTDAHLSFNFSGDDESKDAAIQAVITSQEKLCGVSNMLKKVMTLSWDIYYNNQKVFQHTNQ